MVGRRVVAAVVLGTLLNPLNSSAISVGLVSISHDFGVSLAASATLVIAFYLTSGIGQPTMGRLADRFGPRRTFVTGMAITTAACLAAPFAPTLAWLIAARVVMGVGTAAAFPSGLALIRAAAGRGPTPTGALGALAVVSSGAAALGPAVGGVAVSLAGWEALFLLNVPITLTAIVLALRWLPDVPGSGRAAHGDGPRGVGLLVVPSLRGVYAAFITIGIGFYALFYGLPVWLEQVRGFDASAAGLLMVPIAGLSVAATPLAARLIRRRGGRWAIGVGAAGVAAGAVPLLAYGADTPVVAIVLVGAVLGVALAFTFLGLQTRLYEGAPEGRMGAASGLFQTCRAVGGILGTVLVGLAFGHAADSAGLHAIALAVVALGALVAVSSLRTR